MPEKYVIKLCNRSTVKEIWFVLWYRSVSFWGIIVICNIKYLNKCNSKIIHIAKYFGKSFLMENNPPKSFSSLLKQCFNVNYVIIVTRGKLISSSIFLSSYNLKYFLKNATIYNSRDQEVMFINSLNIRYIFCNKHFNDFLECQMSKDKLLCLQ